MKFIFLFLSIITLNYALEVENTIQEDKACDVVSIQNIQTKASMKKWLEGGFGLTPYRENYLLPIGYTQDDYVSSVPSDTYGNIEAELQVSLKLNVGNNLFGLHERYFLSYSHQAFWQVYSESSPFRETIYNPEAFVIFPFENSSVSSHLRSFKLALAHRSNGQGNIEETAPDLAEANGVENRSRSVNYVYGEVRFQYDTLMVDFKVWVPLPENDATNDNPDIMDYTGYSSVKLRYFVNENMFTLMGRANIHTKYGAVEATYSHPILDDIYFYTKIFSGYGESLIDYNNKLTKYSAGFSFSR